MNKEQTLEDLYAYGDKRSPTNLKKGIGHFNVFQLDDFMGENSEPLLFNRRIYFKVTLIIGKTRVHYADKVIDIEKQALVFSNPQIPYSWESMSDKQSGVFCVFTESFFQQFGILSEYPVFQPNGNPVYNLSEEQAKYFQQIFQKMFTEINSDYIYKYDVLKNIVIEVLHSAMKLQPDELFVNHQSTNGSERISSLFMELLERQFPIENVNHQIELRSASTYANRLNIHINHLNRVLKETLQQTTSDIIANRILKEAKILLIHTNWNISQIGFCLGFDEISNFSNFFKKHIGVSPTNFRKQMIV
ncbi:helix-turn-helix domain-containing protein [Aureibaculum algae]|uniref:Helix-turn-helix domain-containing protein n=1 Tax=Aureibaculum algae TaxID=2584122 RepID=A0A5B7TQ28_9FLAO|nr:response regulator transcription factor [Aureibaculum algae]QCX37364.1 helix-turn-helix domain-containing protein [Aureibaculum algae]